jgi:hypothetical protein
MSANILFSRRWTVRDCWSQNLILVALFLAHGCITQPIGKHADKRHCAPSKEEMATTWISCCAGTSYFYRMQLWADGKGMLGVVSWTGTVFLYTVVWDYENWHINITTNPSANDGLRLRRLRGVLSGTRELRLIAEGHGWSREITMGTESDLQTSVAAVKAAMSDLSVSITTGADGGASPPTTKDGRPR